MSSRRAFIKNVAVLPATMFFANTSHLMVSTQALPKLSHKFKLSLNLYSFNTLLREGKVDLYDMLDFCAAHNFDAIDPTGYYFPGYPEVPSIEFINNFKRKAFLLGLDISGTGIRNNFTDPDPVKRKKDIALVKKWIEVSSMMGSPHLRIFTGQSDHKGYSREQVFEWMAKDIQNCCAFGEQHGVVVALQNHNEFLKTADDVNQLFERVDSKWFGLNLDIGSYRQKDPYEEIKKNIHHAVTWQIKENVWINGEEQRTDFVKLFSLIKKAGYRGYLPLETLGEGDPFKKVEDLLKEVKKALKTS